MGNGSVRVKDQKKTYGPRLYEYGGRKAMITAFVRHDDQCGNGHNTFSITGEIYAARQLENGWGQIKTEQAFMAGGCIHESGGAIVEISECRAMLASMRAAISQGALAVPEISGRVPIGTIGEWGAASLHDDLTLGRVVRIGCHDIPVAEIERIAASLGE